MTRRLLVIFSALALLLTVAAPALAQGRSGRQSPARLCSSWYETREREIPPGSGNVETITAYWVPMEYPFGVEELPILNRGGCVSTVAAGGGSSPVPYTALSTSAINAQCRMLEREGLEYPYNFYGNPDYLAEGRGDCISFLRAFHLGELPPGPG